MLLEGSLGHAVVARVAELFTDGTPWTQRQWQSGTLDALRHLQALVANGGREGAKGWALGHLRGQVASDPFIPGNDRGAILKVLSVKPEKLTPVSHAARMLGELEGQLTEDYWTWATEYCESLDDTKQVADSAPSADELAWRLAAHLRSSGLSGGWIVNFANFQMKFETTSQRLADVISSARRTARAGSGRWVFVIPLQSRRGFNIPTNDTFLTPRDFEIQFAELFPRHEMPPNRGGLRFTVDAVDKYAAIEGASRSLAALLERHRSSGTKRTLMPSATAWVDPGEWTIGLLHASMSRFRFSELDAGGGSAVFTTLSDELEASIDLLLSANYASERSAVVTSWSALETLFADESDYGDLSVVADRAATILTCIYVRDAFERLAIGHSRNASDDLAERLRSADVSRRAQLISEAIAANRSLSVNRVLGAVAVRRAADIAVPSILASQAQISNALRRLYDVRNQVVHAGVVEPYGLPVTLGNAVSLLSAVVNETISYYRRTGGEARQLAARSRWLLTRASEDVAEPSTLAGL